jgi:hypothetical protein
VGGTVAIEERQTPAPAPALFALHQNCPNPFTRRANGSSVNVTTGFRVDLPVPADIEIAIYDLLAQRVATLVTERKLAGAHLLRWVGRDDLGRPVANGIYFYRLKANSFDGTQQFQQVRRMMALEQSHLARALSFVNAGTWRQSRNQKNLQRIETTQQLEKNFPPLGCFHPLEIFCSSCKDRIRSGLTYLFHFAH